MAQVKCIYCQQYFNRLKEEAVAVSARRYAHKKCYDMYAAKKTQEELDYEELENYIKKLFNEEYVSALIKKQIKDYRREYNFTYSGILKTLFYWYEIKGNSLENKYGIAIVPYVYKQASDYYFALFLAQNANNEKNIADYIPRDREVTISLPEVKRMPPKLFVFDDDDDYEEDYDE